METLQRKIEKLYEQLILVRNDYESLMNKALQKAEFKNCSYYKNRFIIVVDMIKLADKLISKDTINTTIEEKIKHEST